MYIWWIRRWLWSVNGRSRIGVQRKRGSRSTAQAVMWRSLRLVNSSSVVIPTVGWYLSFPIPGKTPFGWWNLALLGTSRLREMAEIIRLRGRTNHGKNRVHEHGEVWEVLDWQSSLRPNQPFIRSVQTGDERWLTDDFEVVIPERFWFFRSSSVVEQAAVNRLAVGSNPTSGANMPA